MINAQMNEQSQYYVIVFALHLYTILSIIDSKNAMLLLAKDVLHFDLDEL